MFNLRVILDKSGTPVSSRYIQLGKQQEENAKTRENLVLDQSGRTDRFVSMGLIAGYQDDMSHDYKRMFHSKQR
jgi:hypothetical protein